MRRVKQSRLLQKVVSIETQVAVTLYYLADSFGLGKSTASKVIFRVTSVISEKTWVKVHSTSQNERRSQKVCLKRLQ